MFTRVRVALGQAFKILSEPEKEFMRLQTRTFEKCVEDYMILLLFVSIVSGILNFAYQLGKAAFFDVYMKIDVQYLNLANYASGKAMALLFFYVFAGTIGLFLISIFLRLFFRRIKYVKLFQVMFYSCSPLLTLGWLQVLLPGLFIWAIMLFWIGIRLHNKETTTMKDSISQRN